MHELQNFYLFVILFELKLNQNSSFPRKHWTLFHISQHDTASVLPLTFTSTAGLQWKKRWNVTFRNPGLFDYRSITFSREAEVHGGRNEGWILRIKLTLMESNAHKVLHFNQ